MGRKIPHINNGFDIKCSFKFDEKEIDDIIEGDWAIREETEIIGFFCESGDQSKEITSTNQFYVFENEYDAVSFCSLILIIESIGDEIYAIEIERKNSGNLRDGSD